MSQRRFAQSPSTALFPASFTTLFAAVGVLGGAGPASGQLCTEPANHHPNPYTTVNDYFTLPDGREWGSTSAVDIDPDGTSVWVADRCGANSCAGSTVDPILKYDTSGNLLTSFGAGMILWPHGIHVDDDGNVWITDARAARPDELADRCGANSCAGSTVDPILKYDTSGNLLTSFGAGMILWPHGIHVDDDGNVWITDARAAPARCAPTNSSGIRARPARGTP